MAPDKSLAAEIEAVLAGRDDERVARILCDVWGYQWDGDPDADENVIPERAGSDYDRPDKVTFIAGAVAIRSQIIAPLIAALQSRAFEDGARRVREQAAETAKHCYSRLELERFNINGQPVRNQHGCDLFMSKKEADRHVSERVEAILALPLQPEGERSDA